MFYYFNFFCPNLIIAFSHSPAQSCHSKSTCHFHLTLPFWPLTQNTTSTFWNISIIMCHFVRDLNNNIYLKHIFYLRQYIQKWHLKCTHWNKHICNIYRFNYTIIHIANVFELYKKIFVQEWMSNYSCNAHTQHLSSLLFYLGSGRIIFLLARAAGVDLDFSIAIR